MLYSALALPKFDSAASNANFGSTSVSHLFTSLHLSTDSTDRSSARMPCSSCHKSGHNIRTCPKYNDQIGEAASLLANGATQIVVCAALDVALPGLGQAVSWTMLLNKIASHDREKTNASKKKSAHSIMFDIGCEFAGA